MGENILWWEVCGKYLPLFSFLCCEYKTFLKKKKAVIKFFFYQIEKNNGVGKMVLIDLLNTGLAQTFNLCKNKINHSLGKVQ